MVGELSRDGSAEATTSRRPTRHVTSRRVAAGSCSGDSGSAYQFHGVMATALCAYRESARQAVLLTGPRTPASAAPTAACFFIHSALEAGEQKQPRRLPKVYIPPSFHSMIAGAGAGLVSSIATCPLDVVKTSLQAQSVKRGASGYEGVVKTCLRIYRQSGLRGFYRGLGPTIAGYLPTWGIYFTVYDFIKDRLRRVPMATAHPYISHIVAAMTAGATGTILTNPLWVVKTRFMAQAVLPPSAPRYRTTFDAVRTIYRNEGFGAFYKGLLPSLLGVSHVAVQFGLYEKCKSMAGRDGHPLTPTEILICSAFSKMVASLATYPHEVLRTRIQVAKNKPRTVPVPVDPASKQLVQTAAGAASTPNRPTELYSPLVTGSNPPLADNGTNNGEARTGGKQAPEAKKWRPRPGGIIDVFQKIYRQDGWRGFYRGLSINLIRTVPSSAVTMLTYELIMRNLSSHS